MKWHLFPVCLLASAFAFAAPPASATRPAPCSVQEPERTIWPQGTLLWGTWRKIATQESSSVMASIQLKGVQRAGLALPGVRLENGQLVGPKDLLGAVFQGEASDGQPIEVAVCDAGPSPQDFSLVRYRIELWNAGTESWYNPCVAAGQSHSPRALAVPGVWDETGARREVKGMFTFACENGAIAKCVEWGYKPWAKKDGRSLVDLHQACTRMVRADYCGDGRSHTHENNPIDIYDGLQMLTPSQEPRALEVFRFEACWDGDGAVCVSRAREGQELKTVLAACPDRFEAARKDLGEGDSCTLVRKGAKAEKALLRNRSRAQGEPVPARVAP